VTGHSHRRQNLLTGEWVLVSPQRARRPWQGRQELPAAPAQPAHDAACHLCPGNVRANGQRNPGYRGPWAFDNDFPALSREPGAAPGSQDLLRSEPESGRCRVVCYTERHDLALSGMDESSLQEVLAFLFDEFAALDREPGISYVQVFENRGEMMGCSNPHPHAQIWATADLPNEPRKEQREQNRYYEEHGRPLLPDYLEAEVRDGSRLVWAGDDAVSLVPYWAAWPFETLLATRRPAPGPADLAEPGLRGFARALRATLRAYDTLFETPMPYSLGFHPRPSDGAEHPEWHFHAHIFPPLLRSATVRKFMVGFEMLGMPQRDLTPEDAAERLREALARAGE